MPLRTTFSAFFAPIFGFCLLMASSATVNANTQNTLYMELKTGRVVIELRPDLAAKHVERIKKLTREGFYNGLKFHRVISGFMAQTGDPTGTGTGGSKLPNVEAEFTKAPFKRGSLGAARTNDPNTANSQFFICFEEAGHLNGKYTMFGQVVEGMEHVDKIKKGNGDGPIYNPDVIVKMQVAADVR